MSAEAIILLDTKSSGRYFNTHTNNEKSFHTMQELLSLCRSARHEDAQPKNTAPFPRCPAEGKVASFHISVYSVDQRGAHGVLQISPSEYVMFRSDEELKRLIGKECSRALTRP